MSVHSRVCCVTLIKQSAANKIYFALIISLVLKFKYITSVPLVAIAHSMGDLCWDLLGWSVD